jgi:hypothetical protein
MDMFTLKVRKPKRRPRPQPRDAFFADPEAVEADYRRFQSSPDISSSPDTSSRLDSRAFHR